MKLEEFEQDYWVVQRPNGYLSSPYGQRTTVVLYSTEGVAKRCCRGKGTVVKVKLVPQTSDRT